MAATILPPVTSFAPLATFGSIPPTEPRSFFYRGPSEPYAAGRNKRPRNDLTTTFEGTGPFGRGLSKEQVYVIPPEEVGNALGPITSSTTTTEKKTKAPQHSDVLLPATGILIGSSSHGFPIGSDLWLMFQLGCRLAAIAQFSSYDIVINPAIYSEKETKAEFKDGFFEDSGNLSDPTNENIMNVIRFMYAPHPPAVSWVASTMRVFKTNRFMDARVSRASLLDVIRKEEDLDQFTAYAGVVRSNASVIQRGVYRAGATDIVTENTTATFEAHFLRWLS